MCGGEHVCVCRGVSVCRCVTKSAGCVHVVKQVGMFVLYKQNEEREPTHALVRVCIMVDEQPSNY